MLSHCRYYYYFMFMAVFLSRPICWIRNLKPDYGVTAYLSMILFIFYVFGVLDWELCKKLWVCMIFISEIVYDFWNGTKLLRQLVEGCAWYETECGADGDWIKWKEKEDEKVYSNYLCFFFFWFSKSLVLEIIFRTWFWMRNCLLNSVELFSKIVIKVHTNTVHFPSYLRGVGAFCFHVQFDHWGFCYFLPVWGMHKRLWKGCWKRKRTKSRLQDGSKSFDKERYCISQNGKML